MEVSRSGYIEIPSFSKGFPVGSNLGSPDSITHKEPKDENITFYYNQDRTRRIFDFVLSTGARIVSLDVASGDSWVPLVTLNINKEPWTKDNPQYKLRVSCFALNEGETYVARLAVQPDGNIFVRDESTLGDAEVMAGLAERGIYFGNQIPDKFDFKETVNSLITQLTDGNISTPKLVAAS